MSKTGILIVSVGKSSYQSLAVNLAISLRAGGGDKIPVALVTDDPSGIMPQDFNLFDTIVEVDRGLNPYLLKTQIYDLSPFKGGTLYIDADSLWNCNFNLPEWLFWISEFEASLGFCTFPAIPNGTPTKEHQKLEWIYLPELRDHYDFRGDFLPVQSSVIYFRRNKENRAFFKEVSALYGNYPPMKSFRGLHPDEPYFSLALSKLRPSYVNLMPDTAVIQAPRINRTEALTRKILTFPGERYNAEIVQFYGAVARQGWNQMGNGYELRK